MCCVTLWLASPTLRIVTCSPHRKAPPANSTCQPRSLNNDSFQNTFQKLYLRSGLKNMRLKSFLMLLNEEMPKNGTWTPLSARNCLKSPIFKSPTRIGLCGRAGVEQGCKDSISSSVFLTSESNQAISFSPSCIFTSKWLGRIRHRKHNSPKSVGRIGYRKHNFTLECLPS